MGRQVQEHTLVDILRNFDLFSSHIKIVDKHSKLVEFCSNAEQRVIFKTLTDCQKEKKNLLILKPRQVGASTGILVWLFWKWYTSPTPITIYSMSHTSASANNFMRTLKNIWSNLPEHLRCRDLSISNTSCLELADTKARIEVKTASGKGGVRSFSANIIHLSEFAFVENAEELLATIFPALNDGLLIAESTPNYFNDCLHQEIIKSQGGGSPWKFLFFKWSDHFAYRIPRSKIEMNEEERTLALDHGLNGLQLAWRRKKISEMGIPKFRRDYPLTIDDAYSATSDAWISSAELAGVEIIQQVESEAVVIEEPMAKEKYAIGADPSTGVGKDYSVVYVMSARTRTPVYMWRSNTIEPAAFANKIQEISVRYNGAKVLAESNSVGLAVYNEFSHIGFHNFWRDSAGSPWLTTSKNKPIILAALRKAIATRQIQAIDSVLMDQLRSIRTDIMGNPDFNSRDNSNGHYDNIMAFALALYCASTIPIANVKSVFEKMVEENQSRERSAASRGTLRSWSR